MSEKETDKIVGELALQGISKSSKSKTGVKTEGKKVLEEDKYLKELEHIIVRDFYPDLPALKEEAEYAQALQKNDTRALRRILLKREAARTGTEKKRTVTDTPSTFETPIATPSATPRDKDGENEKEEKEGEKKAKEGPTHNPEQPKKRSTRDLRLDSYLAQHTSEDNVSFKHMLDEAEQMKRTRHDWLYQAEQERKQHMEDIMALPSIEQQAIEGIKPNNLDSWTYRPKNALMYVPEGETSQLPIPHREIQHDKTRFVSGQKPLDKESIEKARNAQADILRGKVGVDGKELLPTPTPRVNGYSFMGTPSPAPGVDESPLMTWGEIESTPQRLEATTPGPHFKVPAAPKRERIGFALAEKAAKAQRKKKEAVLEHVQRNLAGTSRTDRLTSLSPAAQRLASSKLRIRGRSSDRALRASYTPSPRRTPKTPITPGKSPFTSSKLKTPLGTPASGITPHRAATPKTQHEPSITDDLLSLPNRRPQASDYF